MIRNYYYVLKLLYQGLRVDESSRVVRVPTYRLILTSLDYCSTSRHVLQQSDTWLRPRVCTSPTQIRYGPSKTRPSPYKEVYVTLADQPDSMPLLSSLLYSSPESVP